jgi:DNA-binding HxlR family transcriptional regulator
METSNAKKCPVAQTLKMIGGKWKVLILWNLEGGVKRFHQLQCAIPSITKKMLIQQLRQMETDKLVKRKVYPVVPPKVEYGLTKKARTLGPILQAMYEWGQKNQ